MATFKVPILLLIKSRIQELHTFKNGPGFWPTLYIAANRHVYWQAELLALTIQLRTSQPSILAVLHGWEYKFKLDTFYV